MIYNMLIISQFEKKMIIDISLLSTSLKLRIYEICN